MIIFSWFFADVLLTSEIRRGQETSLMLRSFYLLSFGVSIVRLPSAFASTFDFGDASLIVYAVLNLVGFIFGAMAHETAFLSIRRGC